MDTNLHHPSWNPVKYRHTHPMAKELQKIQGRAGFKISSQRHVLTFYPRARGKRTTIDLTWMNFELARRNMSCTTSSNNYGSDHLMLISEIGLTTPPRNQQHTTTRLDKLDKVLFCNSIENKLSDFLDPETLETTSGIDMAVNTLTDEITQSFPKQGRIVNTNQHRNKAWWNEERLYPLIKERNRARRWMILSQTYEAVCCYWEWNNFVKFSINEIKRNHWRSFLAKAQTP